ncbi:MAG: methyltransferase domain-containing protein [Anaerolineales bacterium]|nr:methyltransferase domain-containing protein [Anaerolineales bacterium]
MDTPDRRHSRYTAQAVWTQQIREYLLAECQPVPERTLDVGCGTGVVTMELPGNVFGIDILLDDIRLATKVSPGPSYISADAFRIPFPSDSFDLVCCHFLLLWLHNPQTALQEMIRVLKPGKSLILFAEPDYGGRIDYPSPLEALGGLQQDALRKQGCDPELGRKLRSLLSVSGLNSVKTGVIGGEWTTDFSLPAEFTSEWETLISDLSGILSPDETTFYAELERKAWLDGTRILYVPTFFARGKKPEHIPSAANNGQLIVP